MTDNEKRFIKSIFSGDSSDHDYYHTIRVYKLATKIAKQENADVKIVQLAALLHDVDDIKLSPDTYVTNESPHAFHTYPTRKQIPYLSLNAFSFVTIS